MRDYDEETMRENTNICLPDLVAKLSVMNVRGWAIDRRTGYTHIAYHEGPGRVEELDFDKLKMDKDRQKNIFMWDQSDRLFFTSMTSAMSITRLISELTWVPDPFILGRGRKKARTGPVADASRDPAVRGHFRRLRDQVALARAASDSARHAMKMDGVRAELRRTMDKCKNKYSLTQEEVVCVLQEEINSILVRGVMDS